MLRNLSPNKSQVTALIFNNTIFIKYFLLMVTYRKVGGIADRLSVRFYNFEFDMWFYLG